MKLIVSVIIVTVKCYKQCLDIAAMGGHSSSHNVTEDENDKIVYQILYGENYDSIKVIPNPVRMFTSISVSGTMKTNNNKFLVCSHAQHALYTRHFVRSPALITD